MSGSGRSLTFVLVHSLILFTTIQFFIFLDFFNHKTYAEQCLKNLIKRWVKSLTCTVQNKKLGDPVKLLLLHTWAHGLCITKVRLWVNILLYLYSGAITLLSLTEYQTDTFISHTRYCALPFFSSFILIHPRTSCTQFDLSRRCFLGHFMREMFRHNPTLHL